MNSLISYPTILGNSSIRNSEITSSTLVVDPEMELCSLMVGATESLSRRDNLYSLFKT